MNRNSDYLDAIYRKGERRDAFWSGFGLAITLVIVIVFGIASLGWLFFPALFLVVSLFYLSIKLSDYVPLEASLIASAMIGYGIYFIYKYLTVPGFSIVSWIF